MGRPIVYCEGCGNSLREADFERGKAHEHDNRPFCTDCKPLPADARKASQKVPAPTPSRTAAPAGPPRKKATGSIPVATPAQPRRAVAAAPSSNAPLIIVGVIAAVIFLIVIVAVANRRPRAASAPPAAPKESSAVPERRPEPPPPSEPRRAGPSARREEAPRAETPLAVPDASARLDAFLAQIRRMILEDPAFQRKDEILSMLGAAEKSAGTRAADVEKIKADYLKAAAAGGSPMKWTDWRITSDPCDGEADKLVPSYGDRGNVYITHPFAREKPASLEREMEIPAGKMTALSLWVAPSQKGDWELRILASGQELKKLTVGPKASGWKLVWVDLSSLAGKKVALRLENAANGWEWEHGHWSDIQISSQ